MCLCVRVLCFVPCRGFGPFAAVLSLRALIIVPPERTVPPTRSYPILVATFGVFAAILLSVSSTCSTASTANAQFGGCGWLHHCCIIGYYFVGLAGLLNKCLHTISCSQDVGVIWNFILTESHLILTASGLLKWTKNLPELWSKIRLERCRASARRREQGP